MTIPYILADGNGNLPDAAKWNDAHDWLTALSNGNFVENPGLEVWNGGTSFTNPADAASLADGWVLEKGGTSAPTADITRESSTKDTGAYSLKVDFGASGAGSANSYIRIKQTVAGYIRFAGARLQFSARVKTATANKVRLSIYDGVAAVQYSAYHTGDGTWQTLSVSLTVNSAPTQILVKLEITSDFNSDAVYFDSVYACAIPAAMSANALTSLTFQDFLVAGGDFLSKVSGGIIQAGITMQAAIAMGGNKITGLGAATADGDALRYEQLKTVWAYRRPVLKWISITTVDVENNTGTANETTILFPDGTYRTVVEDTASTNKYRRFLITAAAEFTSGTEDSGVRSGISEATNTWYAIYAVKSTIDATKFVLAGDTTLPLQANFSTLNSRYGTNGWVYLGMIRNGDNSGATGDILNFAQNGNFTKFINTGAFAGARPVNGTLLASGTSVASVTYSYAAGTGASQIPSNIVSGLVHAVSNVGSTGLVQFTDSGAAYYFGEWYSTATGAQTVVAGVAAGFKLTTPASSNGAIFLGGFFDSVLGVGPNPIL